MSYKPAIDFDIVIATLTGLIELPGGVRDQLEELADDARLAYIDGNARGGAYYLKRMRGIAFDEVKRGTLRAAARARRLTRTTILDWFGEALTIATAFL